MSQVFARSEQLADKIYDVKLLIPEWKVLFALDGKMDPNGIAEFLDLDQSTVENALNHLAELSLATAPAAAEVEETVPEAETAMPEPEQAGETEEIAETAEEQETVETEMTFSSDDEGLQELEPDEDSVDAAGEEDLDSLINDLLKDETGEESETETPAAPSIPAAEEIEQMMGTGEETEIETEEKEDIDLGDIFQDDLSETEQSLEDMLDTIEAEEEAEAPGEGDVEVQPPISETGKKTILVVDDSVVIRKMVEIALENESYNIVSVANGKDALSYLDEKEPNIVILDIMLPDVNGLDVLKAIKASKNIPVVMLSAKDTPRETGKAKELGADDFIPKPFKDEELIGKIHELIGD